MYKDKKLHVTVRTMGKCSRCNRMNERQIYDYGILTYRELEKRMDESSHIIEPLTCKGCGNQYSPEFAVYFDEIRQSEMVRGKISYGNMMETEEYEKMHEGHMKRFDIFRDQEEVFWRAYEDFALSNWPDILKEITKEEYEHAYRQMDLPRQETTAKYRRDVVNRFKSEGDKRTFWRHANHELVYEVYLEVGPLGWIPKKDVSNYGLNRTRFLLLHFPLAESLEELRTEYIGQVFRYEKGDNAFLFRRISQLTDELMRARRRNTDYHHQIERLKVEIAQYQEKLNQAYNQIRKLKEMKPESINRAPADIRKIRQLKGLVRELREEVERLAAMVPEEEIQPPEIEETRQLTEIEDQPRDRSHLRGKTVAIFGRLGEIEEVDGIHIIYHDGDQVDWPLSKVAKEADILVILTRFVSHGVMWRMKEYAIGQDKPIYFVRETNPEKILDMIGRH